MRRPELPGPKDSRAKGSSEMDVVTFMLKHDTSMIDRMLAGAGRLSDDQLDRPITISVGHPERSGGVEGITDTVTLRSLLTHLVWGKEMWLAAVRGVPAPARGDDTMAALRDRHRRVAGRVRGSGPDRADRGPGG
jgi:hypothetical protein